MGKIKANIVKGWITSVIGTLLMILSLLLWFAGMIPLMWEGTVGLVLGCILLLAPRTIEKKVSQLIGAWGGGDVSSSSVKPDVPDEDK